MNLVVLLYLILQVTGKAKILVYTIVQNYHLYFTRCNQKQKNSKKKHTFTGMLSRKFKFTK